MSFQRLSRAWQTNKRRVLNLPAGLARRKLRPIRDKFYSDLWADSARKIDATLEARSDGLVRIQRGAQTTFVADSDLMLDSDLTLRVFANKALHYQMMAAKGLRLPQFERFTLETLAKAEAFRQAQTGPVVIKPADGTGGGRGVITGITDAADLISAARHAAGFNPSLLVEEQLMGACYRLLYFNGDYIDAVRRDSPCVTGDGRTNIGDLIKRENATRLNPDRITALSPLIFDHESRNALAAEGLTKGTVPKADEIVRVKLAVNENGAAQNHVVREDVHPEIIETGRKLVREFGVGFAGLDVTSDDISAPLAENNTLFNEINVNPGIHHHYLVSNPNQSADVAPTILERMFEQRVGTMQI